MKNKYLKKLTRKMLLPALTIIMICLEAGAIIPESAIVSFAKANPSGVEIVVDNSTSTINPSSLEKAIGTSVSNYESLNVYGIDAVTGAAPYVDEEKVEVDAVTGAAPYVDEEDIDMVDVEDEDEDDVDVIDTDGDPTETSKPFVNYTPAPTDRPLVLSDYNCYVNENDALYSNNGLPNYEYRQVYNDAFRMVDFKNTKYFNKIAGVNTESVPLGYTLPDGAIIVSCENKLNIKYLLNGRLYRYQFWVDTPTDLTALEEQRVIKVNTPDKTQLEILTEQGVDLLDATTWKDSQYMNIALGNLNRFNRNVRYNKYLGLESETKYSKLFDTKDSKNRGISNVYVLNNYAKFRTEFEKLIGFSNLYCADINRLTNASTDTFKMLHGISNASSNSVYEYTANNKVTSSWLTSKTKRAKLKALAVKYKLCTSKEKAAPEIAFAVYCGVLGKNNYTKASMAIVPNRRLTRAESLALYSKLKAGYNYHDNSMICGEYVGDNAQAKKEKYRKTKFADYLFGFDRDSRNGSALGIERVALDMNKTSTKSYTKGKMTKAEVIYMIVYNEYTLGAIRSKVKLTDKQVKAYVKKNFNNITIKSTISSDCIKEKSYDISLSMAFTLVMADRLDLLKKDAKGNVSGLYSTITESEMLRIFTAVSAYVLKYTDLDCDSAYTLEVSKRNNRYYETTQASIFYNQYLSKLYEKMENGKKGEIVINVH